MPTARRVDNNGFMTVTGCPVSSWGILEYSAGQIGLDGDANRIVKVFRPESAVNNKKTIESLKNLPLINDHEFLSGNADDTTNPEDYGVDGVVTSNVYYNSPWLLADLKIFSKCMRELIDSGKSELSLGFDCNYTLAPGTHDGQEYEVVQDNIIGNHLALVDVARVTGARVLDGRAFDYMRFDIIPNKRNEEMAKPIKGRGMDSTAVELLRKLVPALQEFLKQEAAEPEHQAEMPEGEVAVEADEVEGIKEEKEGDEEEVVAEAAPEEVAVEQEAAPSLESLLQELIAVLKQDAGAVDEEAMVADGEEEAKVEDGEEEGGEQMPEKVKAGDAAALRQEIYQDMSRREKLYKRVSPMIGAFDHAAMSSEQLAEYSAKRLGVTFGKGGAAQALDAYIMGVERASKKQSKVADSAEPLHHDAIDAYINGGAK